MEKDRKQLCKDKIRQDQEQEADKKKKKMKPYRGYVDALECFNDLFGDREMTRNQLNKEDSGLYTRLRKEGLLDHVIPEKREQRDWNKIDPLEYFREHYGNGDITRSQLSKEDQRLYGRLLKDGLLDQAIPKKKSRDFGDPLEYFKEHYGNREMRRGQLKKENQRLYVKLKKEGLLDQVIPEKIGVTYRGYASALECFNDLFGDREMTRGQL
ncbi:hypothetical protein GF336_03025, partial [Candidatus Woesearchaeota archaeon]|nr:hypothetical protein [Candidatus Woesearchaeota archaeon]